MNDNWGLVPAVMLQQWQDNTKSQRPKHCPQRENWVSRAISFCSAASRAHTQEALTGVRHLMVESLTPEDQAPQMLHSILWSLSASAKREAPKDFSDGRTERARQTSAVTNTYSLGLRWGPHTYLAAFSSRASSALPLPLFRTKPALKAFTHLVSMRMSAFAGFSTALQISSCVTGIDLFMETHRSER